MAQVLIEDRQSASGSTAKIVNIVLWVLQVGAAGMFLDGRFLETVGKSAIGRSV